MKIQMFVLASALFAVTAQANTIVCKGGKNSLGKEIKAVVDQDGNAEVQYAANGHVLVQSTVKLTQSKAVYANDAVLTYSGDDIEIQIDTDGGRVGLDPKTMNEQYDSSIKFMLNGVAQSGTTYCQFSK